MSATAILDQIRAAGVHIRLDPVDPDRLRLAPPDRLTPDLLELAREHKAELLAALRETPARFSGPDCATFERIAAGLRAELERRPALAGIAAYRDVLDPQTGARLTAIISARRQADGTVTVAEIAGDWGDPTLPDLETWTPPGEAS